MTLSKVALFANVRDEKHIKEWAAHHLLIGFDIIVLFDHKSKTPLQNVFENFDKRVIILNVSHLNNGIKMPLMNYAAKIAKHLHVQWMIYLDADEFLILHDKFRGVKQFLNQYPHADSLGVNWLMFGSNYLVEEPEGLILENYTKSSIKLDKHVKSFVRTREIVKAINPHFYNIRNKSRMYGINNAIIGHSPQFNPINLLYNDAPAYIAHYSRQSEETYTNRKILLPRDDTGTKRNTEDIKKIHQQYNDCENLKPTTKYTHNIKQFLSFYTNF
jgi:hypothetical protein